MRDIQVSEEVWQAIAARGKFGETEDDVLRRVFNLPENPAKVVTKISGGLDKQRAYRRTQGPRRIKAINRMSTFIETDQLHVSFQDGASQSWKLPERSDKTAIRKVRDMAVAFAKANGATIGQVNAVKKALTDADYHLIK